MHPSKDYASAISRRPVGGTTMATVGGLSVGSRPGLPEVQDLVLEAVPGSIKDNEWTLVVAGDFFYDRPLDSESPFDDSTKALFGDADVAVVNFEGAIGDGLAPALKSGPHLAMHANAPRQLRALNVSAVTLANNHIMDYGSDGLRKTMQACSSAGLRCCGAGENERVAREPLEITVRGLRVALISLCEREFNVATADIAGAAWVSQPSIEQHIAEVASRNDVVAVFVHGGVAYTPFSPRQRQAQMHRLCDAGATVVVGHHPHVPQGWETRSNSIVIHSLGNFFFVKHGRAPSPRSAWGLAMRMRFRGSRVVHVNPVPIYLDASHRVRVSTGRQRNAALEYLERLNAILADPEQTEACWQEIAVRLWWARYLPKNQKAIMRMSIGRLIDRTVGLDRALGWLNLCRNESHCWTQETALAVLTGEQADRRTNDTSAVVGALFGLLESGVGSAASNAAE